MLGLCLMMQKAVAGRDDAEMRYARALRYTGRCWANASRLAASGHPITRIEPFRECFWRKV